MRSHAARWDRRFNFTCRIASDPNTGILERCPCRISIRKVGYSFFCSVFFCSCNSRRYSGNQWCGTNLWANPETIKTIHEEWSIIFIVYRFAGHRLCNSHRPYDDEINEADGVKETRWSAYLFGQFGFNENQPVRSAQCARIGSFWSGRSKW